MAVTARPPTSRARCCHDRNLHACLTTDLAKLVALCLEQDKGMVWILRTGAPWRDLPKRFGPWQSVYTRFRRWTRQGIWARVLETLAKQHDGESYIIDATIVRAHQDATGAKKGDPKAIGQSRGGPTTKVHAVVDALGNPVRFSLTEGQVHDITQATELLSQVSSANV